jgi:hypothetical protein
MLGCISLVLSTDGTVSVLTRKIFLRCIPLLQTTEDRGGLFCDHDGTQARYPPRLPIWTYGHVWHPGAKGLPEDCCCALLNPGEVSLRPLSVSRWSRWQQALVKSTNQTNFEHLYQLIHERQLSRVPEWPSSLFKIFIWDDAVNDCVDMLDVRRNNRRK